MQYFLGYSSFTNESVFSPTLFVEIRKRLNQTIVNSISELVVAHQKEIESKRVKKQEDDDANKPPIITGNIQTQDSPKDSDSNAGKSCLRFR